MRGRDGSHDVVKFSLGQETQEQEQEQDEGQEQAQGAQAQGQPPIDNREGLVSVQVPVAELVLADGGQMKVRLYKSR